MSMQNIVNQLPAIDTFPTSAPRYPNLWVLINQDLVDQIKPYSRFSGHRKAYELVWECLQKTADIVDDYEIYHTAEGCDGVGRRRGLQLVELGDDTHDHSVHVRFYTQNFKHYRVENNGYSYFAIAASVHYEVDRPSRLHPYVDNCPICGCTGEYEHLYDPAFHNTSSDNKNIFGHDPLGLEVLLFGTAQGNKVPLFQGLDSLGDIFNLTIDVVKKEHMKPDMLTGNLGVVTIDSLKG